MLNLIKHMGEKARITEIVLILLLWGRIKKQEEIPLDAYRWEKKLV